MEEKRPPEGRVLTTHVGLPFSSQRQQELRRRGEQRKRKTKGTHKRKDKRKRKADLNEEWQEFLKDNQKVDEGAYNSSVKRVLWTVIQRYGMEVDVAAGLAKLDQVVAAHESEEAPNLTGDGSEELLLGVLSFEAIFCAQDLSRGIMLLQASLARGNVNGMFSLGSSLLGQRQINQPLLPVISLPEDEQALGFIRQAAEKGHPTALFQMGEYHEIADALLDVEKAEAYLRAATEAGHPTAPFKLAMLYEAGKVRVEGAKEKIMQLLQLAAARRCPEAHLHLASMYRSGSEWEANRSKAASHTMTAADLGFAPAQFILADGFEKGMWGDEVSLTPKGLIELYEKAAEQGFAPAFVRLGKIFWDGEFWFDQNDGKAVEFFTLASKNGNVGAQVYLGWAYKTGRGVTKNVKKAVELLKPHVTEKGHSLAFILLAEMYEQGEGVEKDTNEAARLLELAASLGMDGAEDALVLLHQRGEGLHGMSEETVEHYHSLLRFDPGEWLCDNDREALKVFDKYKVKQKYFVNLNQTKYIKDENGIEAISNWSRSTN